MTFNEIKVYHSNIKILFNFNVHLNEESAMNLCLIFIIGKTVYHECFQMQAVYKRTVSTKEVIEIKLK